MEEITTKEILTMLKNADIDTYRNIFKRVKYTHTDIAKMIHLSPSRVNAWGVRGVKIQQNNLTLLALEIVARKKGYKNLIELVEKSSANSDL